MSDESLVELIMTCSAGADGVINCKSKWDFGGPCWMPKAPCERRWREMGGEAAQSSAVRLERGVQGGVPPGRRRLENFVILLTSRRSEKASDDHTSRRKYFFHHFCFFI